jgi:hypothetical protein
MRATSSLSVLTAFKTSNTFGKLHWLVVLDKQAESELVKDKINMPLMTLV